ncbi:P2R1A-PPP2R2A-interacting phosphatase regulator 1 isoform X1 [Cebidichthys violaceus]|uniref:P2R1A-PPP2R2A-interacting phosphatase regulator 1 isoform X1 n=1 Tax=Cebidichthys violaceus TaxID=271503 RepID=UPI0035C954F2
MERMEVDQCAGAAGGAGGGALRRSNSAPMITSVSDGMTVFSPVSSARYRRSSVSINPSCPSQLVPLSPFSLTGDRPDHKRQEENMMTLRGSLQRLSASSLIPVPPVSQWHNHASVWFQSQDSGATPNSSPSPTRRFRPAVSATVRWPALTPLKRKGNDSSVYIYFKHIADITFYVALVEQTVASLDAHKYGPTRRVIKSLESPIFHLCLLCFCSPPPPKRSIVLL